MIDYQRVAKAIVYIKKHSADQPNLDDIANAIHLSPYHFHRLFKEWAGVTPKEFLQYISLNHAKKLLNNNRSIEDASFYTGLSSSSRLHDLFITMEGMTPGEFKKGGQELDILYQFSESPFGDIMVASTERGICNLMFVKDSEQGLRELREIWYQANIRHGRNAHIENIEKVFTRDWNDLEEIKLHVKGSKFHLKVWEALLKLPAGALSTYSDIAKKAGSPKAYRAVGTALARNPVGYLIPCHRVIKKVGGIGEYRWGSTRKTAMIGWEVAQVQTNSHD